MCLCHCLLLCTVGPLEAGAEESREGDVIMKGTLSSPNCGVVLSLNGTTTHIEEHFAKAINYTLMITAVSFLQVCKAPAPCLLKSILDTGSVSVAVSRGHGRYCPFVRNDLLTMRRR